MPQTASDIFVEALIDWGVEVIFGLPGDGINGVMEALRTRQDRIRFVQARHEEAAAFMAVAYAKWTGKLGVCLATTGPGGTHLLTGLYDAKFDRAPVLAITGLPYHDLIGTYTQQDIDHTKVFQDVAAYTTAIYGAQHVRQATALACRAALADRGVAHLAFPSDVQEQSLENDEPSPRHKADPRVTYTENARLPDDEAIAGAAEVLNAGRRVAILAGQGALAAGAELARTAELLGAPIAKALLGKAVLPDDHPYVTGGVGYLGARPSQQVLEACDALLIVGSNFPYVEYYPQPDQARAVQIDLDPRRIGLRFPAEVGVVGDAAASLRALNDRLQARTDPSFLAQAQAWKREWLDALAEGAHRPGKPMKPQRVVFELNRRLPPDAIIAADSGFNTALAAQYLMIREGQTFGVSGTLASMGCGLPYAIGACIAHPDRTAVAVVGDGGLSMSLAELATAARYRLPIKVVVINNGSLGQIKWEQMLFLGNPEFGCELAPVDFAKVADGLGVRGLRVEDPEAIGPALEDAFATEGPVLIDAVVDSAEIMLPPKRREAYMEHLAQAFKTGTAGQDAIQQRMREEPAATSLKR
ncbi:thiamine pyrophosphate-dependent enzyme [Phenylobacterium sp.]|uniref:thiamine pyrophosphate-dependent enzyme n=1 Tax=Phenylobacterium sp. TaxID=1871053 RepID=UPI0025CCFA9E|nr:thiamine pyrophosphate-dependent enzyme [Phenylobacterium sp.]